MSFSTLVLMFALTWRKRKRERQKDLERVIKKKGIEFRWEKNMTISSRRCRENMRNASSQQGEISGSEKIKANINTGNKIFVMHVRHFLHKNNV